MNKLEEYGTPETNDFLKTAQSVFELIGHARKLERKLAMCRDALRELDKVFFIRANPADNSVDVNKVRKHINETIKATEPK